MTQLPKISASKIKVFEECSNQYVAKYVLKQPQQLTSYGVVGQAIHHAIDLAYTENVFPFDTARNFIRQEYMTTFAAENYIGWGENQALEKTYALLDNVPFEDYVPMAIEKEFLVPFPAEDPICLLHGYIDLISEDKQIIDWKSQSRVPTKKESATQLAIYYYAFTQLYHTEPSRVFIFHLPTQKTVELSKDILLNKLIELELTISQMLALSDVTETTSCGRCGVFCPLYGATNNER